MFLLLRLSLRNLFRQKRRNLLLGSAMAIGVALLVLANAFSNGLTDIMMNKVLRWVTGHVTIGVYERGRMMSQVFRDKTVFDFVRKDFKDVLLESEEAIGVMVRGIGNGKADNLILVGVDIDPNEVLDEKALKEMEESFHLVQGRWEDLNDARYENPVILSEDRCRYLNLKLHDVVRLRLRNIFGQDQAARATVVGIMTTGNIFMGPVVFGNVEQVKTLLGYDEHSCGSINLTLKEPQKNARWVADAIHDRLQAPGLAAIAGTAEAEDGRRARALVMGFNGNSTEAQALAAHLEILAGSMEKTRLDKAAWVAQPLARELGVGVGSALSVRYTDKWGAPTGNFTLRVGGIFRPGKQWDPRAILLTDHRFYEAFYAHWPRPITTADGFVLPGKDHPDYDFLSPEWIMLPRTYTTEDMMKKARELGKGKWHATVIDIGTMYETAEEILKMQGVLNLITIAAVLVLFAIILIGVVNTLRMTIRERTREIGTIRAIGMQRSDVRNAFIYETMLLAFFSSIMGVLLALLAMWGLSSITLNMSDNPMGMFLVKGHLYFLPTLGSVAGYTLLIMVLAGATAWFPARRAARLAPGAALRHSE
ncbi:MAG: FtsX-like permease family protein [candidate division FCPU426 bacterium]